MCQGWTPAPRRSPLGLGGLVGIALIAAQPVLADGPEYPTSRLGMRTAPLLLLSRADVRTELRLTPAQAASAEQAITDLYTRAMTLRNKSGPEIIAVRAAIDQAMQHWIDTQLTAEQRARLAQIDLQWEGPAALLSRPKLADTLALTPQQRKALKQAIAERDHRRDQHGPNVEDDRQLFNQARAILSREQQDRWRALLGPPFIPQEAQSNNSRPR
jgi:hypothetical protein